MILIIISLVSAPPSIVWTALPDTDLTAGETLWTNPDVPGARSRGKSPQSCTGGGSASRRPGKPLLHAMAARSRRGFDRGGDAA